MTSGHVMRLRTRSPSPPVRPLVFSSIAGTFQYLEHTIHYHGADNFSNGSFNPLTAKAALLPTRQVDGLLGGALGYAAGSGGQLARFDLGHRDQACQAPLAGV